MKKPLKKILPFLVLALAGAGAWLKLVPFESEKPILGFIQDSPVVGRELGFRAVDRKSGLAEVRVDAVQDGPVVAIFAEKFPKKTPLVERTISLRPLPPGLKDGEVLLRITATDHSLAGGNATVLEKRLIIDTQPPRLSVSGGQHYINRGGAGFVTLTANEELASSGIQVGEVLYPGFSADKGRYLAFFALPFDAPQGIAFTAWAEDPAGNRTRTGFRPIVKSKPFKSDKIQITEAFLSNVIPYFKERDPNLQGTDIEIFLTLNRKQRVLDFERIQEICRETAPRSLWSGPFLRLPDSKPMASFAQSRIYYYQGREIDRQVHLGVDLASLAQCPVPAANAGRVVFAGPLGIYGETVVLDHGCGLFSMYSHLSRIDIEVKTEVARGDVLGLSGSTGMAGGDHLHYAMLVKGTFVNPIEWWDEHWIKDNIDLKMR